MQTIRNRLIIILVVCFSFIVGLTCVDYYHIFSLQKKLVLIAHLFERKLIRQVITGSYAF